MSRADRTVQLNAVAAHANASACVPRIKVALFHECAMNNLKGVGTNMCNLQTAVCVNTKVLYVQGTSLTLVLLTLQLFSIC